MRNGIITAKLSTMESNLLKLRNHIPETFDEFKHDWGKQKIAERVLQILIEGMIDIASRCIALSGGAPPATSADAIKRIGELGIIENSEKYIPMVRFRNFIVHNYDSVEPEILYSILTKKLSDFEDFIKEVKSHADF